MNVLANTYLSSMTAAIQPYAAIAHFDPGLYVLEPSFPHPSQETKASLYTASVPAASENIAFARGFNLDSNPTVSLMRIENKSNARSHRSTRTANAAITTAALMTMGCNAHEQKVGQIAGFCALTIAGLLILRAIVSKDKKPKPSSNDTAQPTKPRTELRKPSTHLAEDVSVRLNTIKKLSKKLSLLKKQQYAKIIQVTLLIVQAFDDVDEEVRLAAVESLGKSAHLLRGLDICGHVACRYNEMTHSDSASDKLRLAAIRSLGKTLPNIMSVHAETDDIRHFRAGSMVSNLWDANGEIRITTADILLGSMQNAKSAYEARCYAKEIVRMACRELKKISESKTHDKKNMHAQIDSLEFMEVFTDAIRRVDDKNQSIRASQLTSILIQTEDASITKAVLLLFRDAISPIVGINAIPAVEKIGDIEMKHADEHVRDLATQVHEEIYKSLIHPSQ